MKQYFLVDSIQLSLYRSCSPRCLLCSWCWTLRRCACRAYLWAKEGFPETPRVSSRSASVPAVSSSSPRRGSPPLAVRIRSARKTKSSIFHLSVHTFSGRQQAQLRVLFCFFLNLFSHHSGAVMISMLRAHWHIEACKNTNACWRTCWRCH